MAKPAPLVLIVDDFEDNREMYAQYLRFHGYDVAEADNGQDALSQASGLRPDVIVMDLSLPGMDGWEATRRLKQDAADAGHPGHRAHRPRADRARSTRRARRAATAS